jgi:hypothetical protein
MRVRAKDCFESQFDIAVTSDRFFSLLLAKARRGAPVAA